MESDILMAGGPVCDFSENNLVNHVGFNPPMTVNDGGDEDMAIAYMSNLNGPGNESDDPYVGYDNHLTDPCRSRGSTSWRIATFTRRWAR